jgi:hypothetical protein
MHPVVAKPDTIQQNVRAGFVTYNDQRFGKTVQKAPYNIVTSYKRLTGVASQLIYEGPSFGSSPFDAYNLWYQYFSARDLDLASNQAYDRLKGKLYTQAALGVDFVETRQSLAMIAKATSTILRSFNQVRKFNFLGAAQTLRLAYVPKGVSARKSAANNWLEYHFGWEPLVRDVYDSIEIINNPLKSYESAKGSGKVQEVFSVSENFTSITRTTDVVRTTRVQQGAAVRGINNGALHSLDQFGLLNPLSIAWEIVPFSFVIDWFANVGQVLSSYSDFAGMSLEKTWTSLQQTTYARGRNTLNPGYTSEYPGQAYEGVGAYFERIASLTQPVFSVKHLKLPSKERAATAVSLLIQQFSKR